MPYRTLILLLALGASLLGCSKSSNQGLAANKSVNLGTVDLSYGVPARQDLGDQVVCVLTAQPLTAGNCELFAALERSGKQVASTRVAPATLDQPMQLSFGNAQISLTPHIK